jgi:CTP:molybdopterin cytidylyltransferase MocA
VTGEPASAVAGIVLAAGAGRRMGGPKALVELDGEPLVCRTIRLARAAGCAPVLVVLGAQADDVRARIEPAGVEVAIAADWERGMSASLKAGLSLASSTSASAAVVLLVDQPMIGAEAIERLREAWRAGATAAVACYDGQPRNPVLFDRSVWSAVAEAADGDVGARPWLRAHPDLVERVECGDTGSALDVDTPADLAGLDPRAGGPA